MLLDNQLLPKMHYITAIILLPLVISTPFEAIGKTLQENKSDDILLVTFNGEPRTTFTFKQMNDPVMVKLFWFSK